MIGLDCRGHGHSDKPHDEASYAVQVMAGDVKRLLDHVGVDRADYLGYSMGARIGLELILDHPDRVSRAVLGGVGAARAVESAAEIAHAFRIREPTDDAVASSFYSFASSRPGNDLDALAACIVGLSPDFDPDRLGEIATPVLIVVGENDDLARSAPELIELVPTARLVTIPGRDHLSAVPAGEFKRAALDFLGD